MKALDSEYGNRLVELALEHLRIMKQIPPEPTIPKEAGIPDKFELTREILKIKAELIKLEQEDIISRYENEEYEDSY